MVALTSTQEDYIEQVFRLQDEFPEGIRVSDLANHLGCRMPTVTRTVKTLSEAGFFDHPDRGLVQLTKKGKVLAAEIAHRHDDIVAFLELVLGVPKDQAYRDACQIEHGISAITAERLHAFMLYFEALPLRDREQLSKAVKGSDSQSFSHIKSTRRRGWRC